MKFAQTLLLASIVTLSQQSHGTESNESERLNAWLDARYEEELAFSPMAQTDLGRRQQYDQIDDYSIAGSRSQTQWLLGTARELRQTFDYAALDEEARVSYDYWLYRAEFAQADARWRLHDYVLDQQGSTHTALPQFLLSKHAVSSVQDMRDYISRLYGIARAIDQLLGRAQLAARADIRAPRFAYDTVMDQARDVISGAPFTEGDSSPLWADILDKSGALATSGLADEEQVAGLRKEARVALQQAVQPAYQRLIEWYSQDREHTDAAAQGVHSLPDGEGYYAHRLREFTTTDLDAETIHALGLEEVARIRTEMEAIKEAVGFNGSLQDFFEFVRDDPQFYYPDTDAGRKAFIEETRQYLAEIEDRLPAYFGILPESTLEVRRVEPFRERDGAAAFYRVGTVDGSRPGVYYLHLSDMDAKNRTDLQTTAYHEGSPGHHMQLSIALENRALPLFRTREWYSAYGEGWALYAEYLAWEMGLFDNPYYDFGRLGAEMFRAIRLVVDTGLHAKGWSEEQAVQYMLDNSAIPETSVRSEIRRYLVWPGQATSYKVGMLKILELRERASRALGDDFDIRAFHDLLLAGGALPLALLERRVDAWVSAQR